jgi:hypothetical protein
MKNKVPYGQTFALKTALENVKCWNFTTDQTFTVPAGLLVRLENVDDATHTTVCVVDSEGKAPGIELTYIPRYFAHIASTHELQPITALGYRFIVENQALGSAIGIPMPKKTADLVGDIIAYESGMADEKQTKRLFKTLKTTGIGSKLQGHYSSRM